MLSMESFAYLLVQRPISFSFPIFSSEIREKSEVYAFRKGERDAIFAKVPSDAKILIHSDLQVHRLTEDEWMRNVRILRESSTKSWVTIVEQDLLVQNRIVWYCIHPKVQEKDVVRQWIRERTEIREKYMVVRGVPEISRLALLVKNGCRQGWKGHYLIVLLDSSDLSCSEDVRRTGETLLAARNQGLPLPELNLPTPRILVFSSFPPDPSLYSKCNLRYLIPGPNGPQILPWE